MFSSVQKQSHISLTKKLFFFKDYYEHATRP